MMEGFESEGFGKAHEGRAFVREGDPREGPFSRTGTPYVPHNVVYRGSMPEKHQLPAPLKIPTGARFSGLGDVVTTIKSFFTLHPWLSIGALVGIVGFSSGAFKGFLENPFDDDDGEDLFD
jgi:hypothetical protein